MAEITTAEEESFADSLAEYFDAEAERRDEIGAALDPAYVVQSTILPPGLNEDGVEVTSAPPEGMELAYSPPGLELAYCPPGLELAYCPTGLELAYCPTGKGGGKDPTCSPGGGKSLAKTAKQLKKLTIASVKNFLEERGLEMVQMTSTAKGTAKYMIADPGGLVQAELTDKQVKEFLKEDTDDIEAFADKKGILVQEFEEDEETLADLEDEDEEDGSFEFEDDEGNIVTKDTAEHIQGQIDTVKEKIAAVKAGEDIGVSLSALKKQRAELYKELDAINKGEIDTRGEIKTETGTAKDFEPCCPDRVQDQLDYTQGVLGGDEGEELATAVDSYTGGGYEDMNGYLRKNKIEPDEEVTVEESKGRGSDEIEEEMDSNSEKLDKLNDKLDDLDDRMGDTNEGTAKMAKLEAQQAKLQDEIDELEATNDELGDELQEAFDNEDEFDIEGGMSVTAAIAAMDEAIAGAPELKKDVQVLRGVEGTSFTKLKPGDRFKDFGYLSTTLDPDTAESFAGTAASNKSFGSTLLRITVAKGTQALYQEDTGEAELILPRGRELEILARKIVNGVRILDAKIVN